MNFVKRLFTVVCFLCVKTLAQTPIMEKTESSEEVGFDSYFKTATYADFVSHANKSEMNQIAFESNNSFWDKWHLVVARYREDTREMRLTYANPIAWDAVQKGIRDFPNGSVFGKIGYKTESDALFFNSRLPSTVSRYQFMVKDDSKYTQTRGWGYAIFSSNGKTLPDDPNKITAACANCHESAQTRGYVFLGQMNATPKAGDIHFPSGAAEGRVLSSQEASLRDLLLDKANVDKTLKALGFSLVKNAAIQLPESALVQDVKVTQLVGRMAASDKVFDGTLVELAPLLLAYSAQQKETSAFVSEDGQYWIVVGAPNEDHCQLVRFRGPAAPPSMATRYTTCSR